MFAESTELPSSNLYMVTFKFVSTSDLSFVFRFHLFALF